MSTSKGVPALDETMEGSLYSFIRTFFGFSSQCVLVSAFLWLSNFSLLIGIPIKDPAYFTSERDWSLMSFLYYRQKCSDFLPNKMEEHDRYTRNLISIIGYEKAPTSIVKRAGKALGLMHVKCFSPHHKSAIGKHILFSSGWVWRVIALWMGLRPAFNHPHYLFTDGKCMSYGLWWFRPVWMVFYLVGSGQVWRVIALWMGLRPAFNHPHYLFTDGKCMSYGLWWFCPCNWSCIELWLIIV